jgi:predicted DNA-binding transcriptional regulator YafY
MASAQLKLLAALPRAWQPEVHRISSRFFVDLAGWYRRSGPVHHLRALADAVWADRRVTVSYESWKGLVERELEPLGLVIKAGEWYAVALPRSGTGERGRAREPRTYRVSNIRALAVEGSFVRPKRFDLGRYWSESTQRFEREIYRGTALVQLTPRGRRLLCSASTAVRDAIDRATAAAGDLAPNASLRVAIPIESFDHATGQILALGTDVEVLEPAALRDHIRHAARAIAAIYGAGD